MTQAVSGDQVTSAYKNLGFALRQRRKMAGLTQTALAERVFFSRSTVANIELGRHSVRREFWERVDAAVSADGELLSAFGRAQELARLVRQQAEHRSIDCGHEHSTDELGGLRRSELELTISGELRLTVTTTAEGAVRVVIDAGQSNFPEAGAANDAGVSSLARARLRRADRLVPRAHRTDEPHDHDDLLDSGGERPARSRTEHR